MITYQPYMENGYYPHVQQNFWARVKVAWRVIWHGEFFPQPETWYEPLFNLVYGHMGTCARKAVEKVNREYEQDKTTRSIRLREAQEWALTYMRESGVYQAGMRPGTINFLIEWWVARLGHKF